MWNAFGRRCTVRTQLVRAGALVLLLVVLALSVSLVVRDGHVPRAVGLPHTGTVYDNGSLGDMRDTLYYPGRALLSGHDPYDVPGTWARYPTTNWLPLYAPDHLLLGAALSLMPFPVAGAVWTLVNVGLLFGLAWLAVRSAVRRPEPAAVLLVAAVVLASRPGRDTFVSGQTTLLYCGATWLAWAWSGAWSGARSATTGVQTRPWPAAIALAIALTKPPFGLPLLVLLMAQRQWRTVVRGLGLCAAASLPVVIVLLASAGPARLLGDLRTNLAITRSSVPDRLGGVRRVDAASLLARLLPDVVPATALELGTAVSVLVLAVFALERARRLGAPPAVPAAVAAAAVVLAVPHQSYDLLLLAAPLCGLAVGRVRLPVAVTAGLVLVIAALPAGVLLRLVGRPDDLPAVTSVTSAAVLLLLLAGVTALRRPTSEVLRPAPV